MSIFQPTPPEKIIFEFSVKYVSDSFYSCEGILFVTNLRILYYRKKPLRNELEVGLNIPLGSLKVKFKKSFGEDSRIIIKKTNLVIDLYDNKLVSEWLKGLIQIAKSNKGFPIPIPENLPPFVTKSDNGTVPNKLNSNNHSLRKCPHCGGDINIEARFCTNCGNQI